MIFKAPSTHFRNFTLLSSFSVTVSPINQQTENSRGLKFAVKIYVGLNIQRQYRDRFFISLKHYACCNLVNPFKRLLSFCSRSGHQCKQAANQEHKWIKLVGYFVIRKWLQKSAEVNKFIVHVLVFLLAGLCKIWGIIHIKSLI